MKVKSTLSEMSKQKRMRKLSLLKKKLKELNPSRSTIEEMHFKLVGYQTFMAEYIVKAQEEKYKAVKNAEKAISEKYEAEISSFMLPQAADTSTSKKDSAVTTKSAKYEP